MAEQREISIEGLLRWMLAVIFFLLSAGRVHANEDVRGPVGVQVVERAAHVSEFDPVHLTHALGLAGTTADLYLLKVWTALKAGDVTAAVSAYMSAKGLSEVPQWLQAFQRAFAVANRVAGPCKQVARDIFTGLKNFGGNPEYLRVQSTGGEFLTWQGKVMVSGNNFHVVVRQGGRLYDAFTGAAGMTESEYAAALMYEGRLVLTVVSAP